MFDKYDNIDELIRSAIDTSKPQFDAEKWNEKYASEVELLKSRAGHGLTPRPNIWWSICKTEITKLTAAAAIIIAIGLFVIQHRPAEKTEPAKVSEITKSPAELTTLASLTIAYRKGGMELVEEICDKAVTLAGPRPAKISIQDLLEKTNGGNSERIKL